MMTKVVTALNTIMLFIIVLFPLSLLNNSVNLLPNVFFFDSQSVALVELHDCGCKVVVRSGKLVTFFGVELF